MKMKYDKNKHKFAVVQHACGLYGVGETELMAIEDSVDWIDGVENVEDVKKLIEKNKNHNCPFEIITNPDEIKLYMDNI